ncbi:MAG: DUF1549 domain-containing protein, partial [Verrucomicrobiota bacterium]
MTFRLLIVGLSLPLLAAQGEQTIRFNRDIRPIFSESCYTCHGPGLRKPKGGLHLHEKNPKIDRRLIERLISPDPEERMPPPESGLTVTPEDIERLRRWINSGADYEPHWAYVPPVRSSNKSIDALIRERLAAEQLEPSPPADRRTLIRRLSFDLRGLPPSIDEVNAFLEDREEGAYERLVDRFLASPHYGERMAQDWLDHARYADTTGFAADKPRTMWLYREWVIDAFNRNLPFDRFTVEQLAGDMLP